MKQFKRILLTIFALLFAGLMIACNHSTEDESLSGSSVVCTYVERKDDSSYYIFYADGRIEVYTNGELVPTEYNYKYEGNPLQEGTVSVKGLNAELFSFEVTERDGELIAEQYMSGWSTGLEFTIKKGDGNSGGGNDNSGDDKTTSENSGKEDDEYNYGSDELVCKYVQSDNDFVYFDFYGDRTFDSNGAFRDQYIYEGNPLKVGSTVRVKLKLQGVEIYVFRVEERDGELIAIMDVYGKAEQEYKIKTGKDDTSGSGENDNSGGDDNTSDSPLMFMGFDNVVTLPSGTTANEITEKILNLTSDTTLKFRGGINSYMLISIANAMGINDSVKIALDFSEATGITEWTNKLAGVKTLYAISLPSTVTSVERDAFKNCTNLAAITVPCSITSYPYESTTYSPYISYYTGIIINFSGTLADWLQSSAEIPSGKTLYLNGARLKLSGTVTIPDSVTTIKSRTFSGCTELTNVIIPSNVTRIGAYAFSGCSGLTSVTIPESVTLIEDGAFYYCRALKELIIADGTTRLYFSGDNSNYISNVLYECPLETLYLGRSFDYYGVSPFSSHGTLVSVEISNNVTSIPTSGFVECSGLTSITIPSTVTSLGSQAFYNCRNLKEVIIADGDEAINLLGNSTKNLFENCPLETVYLGRNLNAEDDGYDRLFYKKTTLISVEIGSDVTKINAYTFYGCSSLTTVNYRGSESQWQAISIYPGNTPLKNATIVYNYTGD